MIDAALVREFRELFAGYPRAFGTGQGGWVKRAPNEQDYRAHLDGTSHGLGIGPLMENGRCLFAAIDLDEPDFKAAGEMATLLPGTNWIERSRSGNAHILVFFAAPIEAWIVRGILRETLAALGRRDVEVFPKSDKLLPGMFGNYLNLPYFGDTRQVVGWKDDEGLKWTQPPALRQDRMGLELERFVALATANRNDPDDWRKRARWLGIPSPEERQQHGAREFGTSSHLHVCAEHVIANRDSNPVAVGHRAVVYFSLAKMLSNWSEIDSEEALSLMALVNDSSTDPISGHELRRILSNAERGQFTSTGCDDPLFLPYRSPDCKIGA